MADLGPFSPAAPLALLLAGALLALVSLRAAHLAAFIGSLGGAAIAVRSLLDGSVQTAHLFTIAPFADISIRIDPLAAFFLLVISVLAAAVSLYALGYVDGAHGEGPGLGAAYNIFLASMMLVVLADSVFTFLFAWELMSLASFLLVVHDHQQAEVRRAGYIYLVMTHLGTVFLTVGFFMLAAFSGNPAFASFREAAPALPPVSRDLVFLLALAGFGTKAGLVPVHIWLPRAHPAAPSHVSALMSGVMIKTAVYGLLRVGWDFAGPGPDWWGGLLLTLGAVSAVLGVLNALMEHDLKRLLAYSSVENIGIIFMGIGAAFLLAARGLPGAAALALFASLYHVMNHAAFKGLLFLGVGAVQRAVHTRDSERLGGLVRAMPWTAAAFLTGSVAIAGLPPFSGFVSEWLTFQSLLQLTGTSSGPVEVTGAALATGALALTGGLAAYCFVKAFGITFLGVSRSAIPDDTREAGPAMLGAMGALALLCVALGLAPSVMTRLLAPVTLALTGATAQLVLGLAPNSAASGGSLAPVGVLTFLVALGGLGLLLARLLGGPAVRRIAPPWVCGVALEPRMQYSGAALAKPVRLIFQALLQPQRTVGRVFAQAPYFVESVHYEAGLTAVYERYLYRPPVRALLGAAHRVRALQNGSLRLYLGYMFMTLVAALLLTR